MPGKRSTVVTPRTLAPKGTALSALTVGALELASPEASHYITTRGRCKPLHHGLQPQGQWVQATALLLQAVTVPLATQIGGTKGAEGLNRLPTRRALERVGFNEYTCSYLTIPHYI